MGQIQTNTNVNTMKNVNTTSGSFLEGVAKQFLNWAHPRFRPTIQRRNKKQALPTPVYGTSHISHVHSYLMPSDVKCQPHPKQLHLLVLLKGFLPSQFTDEFSATCSNEFYSANLPASSPTLAAPSANCYASLQ